MIRSVVGQRDEHTSYQEPHRLLASVKSSEISIRISDRSSRKSKGPADSVMPPFVDLFPTMQHRPYNSTGAGYLGNQFNQVRADGEDLASMKVRYIESTQFGNRQKLLQGIDHFRQTADRAGTSGLEESYHRAFEVLTSTKLMQAMDIKARRSSDASDAMHWVLPNILAMVPRSGMNNC